MAEYRSDPELEPGTTALCARRTLAGTAFHWTPGSDADAYVAHVGLEYLTVVDGKVYVRDSATGNLYPHDMMSQPHVAVRVVAGDPIYMSPLEFKAQWAALTLDDDPGIVKRLEWELAAAKADVAEHQEMLAAADKTLNDVVAQRVADAEAFRSEIEALTAQLAAKQAELDDLWADYIGAPKNDESVVPQTIRADESSQHPGTQEVDGPGAGAPRKAGKR